MVYRAASFDIVIKNIGSNFGYSVMCEKLQYYVSARRRRSGRTNNIPADGLVSGPFTDYVRLVKVSPGNYEIQVRQKSDWRHMEVTAKLTSTLEQSIEYLNTPIIGHTGTTYYAQNLHYDYLTNGMFSGNVGIGISNPDNKLEVNGTIRAKEVLVETSGWADFVFEHDYQLKPLSEVEQFIEKYKHLPDIPSTKEVKENGISVDEMNALLLQKVEELTLHIIELKKENKQFKLFEQRIKGIESKLRQS